MASLWGSIPTNSVGTIGLNMFTLNINQWAYLTFTTQTSTQAIGDLRVLGMSQYQTTFSGYGFVYDGVGNLVDGIVIAIAETNTVGDSGWYLEGISVSVPQLVAWVSDPQYGTIAAAATMLGGNDDVTGTYKNDVLLGFNGNDWLSGGDGDDLLSGDVLESDFGNDALLGGAGNDVLLGLSGNDLLDGGPGYDNAIYDGTLADYEVVTYKGVTAPLTRGDHIHALSGSDRLVNVELLTFVNNPDIDGDEQTIAVPGQNFSALEYTASYVDLMNAFGTNDMASFEHYITYGFREGRTVTFDGLDYIASYADLMSAFGTNADAGALHYIMNGRTEGRWVNFDGLQYLASHPDLIAAYGGPGLPDARVGGDRGASHYINWGHSESRVTDSFDAQQYLGNYADLQAAFGNDLDAATLHYIRYGYLEGRIDEPRATPFLLPRNSAGIQGNGGGGDAELSVDGRYVVFQSWSSNLVPGDTNQTADIFVKDLQSGVLQRVSTDAAGGQSNDWSSDGRFSVDGRYVVFGSFSSNLVPDDTNESYDIFVKDLQSGAIQRVSTDAAGTQGNNNSVGGGVFSADGRYVIFKSVASNLVPDDTNETWDIFVKDLRSGAIQRVSTSASGEQSTGSLNPDQPGTHYPGEFSPDGRYVVFSSDATNLVPGDTIYAWDIFVKDLQTGAIQRVSTDAEGGQANFSSDYGRFSADGRHVVFESFATNLVPGDSNFRTDVFIKDLQSGAIKLVSTTATGEQGNEWSGHAELSPDGRYVVFGSFASNLVPDDTNDNYDIFVKDLETGAIQCVSTDAIGVEGDGWSSGATFSADGHYVIFQSGASNLVPGDINGQGDIFVVRNPFVQTDDDFAYPAQSIVITGVPDGVATDFTII